MPDPSPAERGGRSSAAGTALEKAMRVLEAVAAPGGPHRLAELTAAAEVPKSTTFRILASLVGQGFVRTEAENRYAPGSRLRALAAQVGAAEPAGVEQVLAELRDATGQTVHLALHSGESITYVQKLENPDQPFRTASRVGLRMPLHCTAIGKSVLAHLPAAEADALLAAAGLPRRTPRTVTDPEALRTELAAVRARGFAVDDEENEPGIRCLGAPVLSPTGRPLGGVSVTTVSFLVPREQLESFAPALLAATTALAPLL
ncbi:IclR family transcriptional regulator [Streptacidiphilus rugosus]|uniref:IclR family transcriptional regulator n=1 Tax=Streptacidiphilus rugosus TaxID=405783 RepID=UPI0007C7D0BE|nr:IclR family transcriptional regulator [Streptacidiphilus rugosus]